MRIWETGIKLIAINLQLVLCKNAKCVSPIYRLKVANQISQQSQRASSLLSPLLLSHNTIHIFYQLALNPSLKIIFLFSNIILLSLCCPPASLSSCHPVICPCFGKRERKEEEFQISQLLVVENNLIKSLLNDLDIDIDRYIERDIDHY